MISVVARVFPWLLLAPAYIPLIFIDGLLYPYVTPKTLLLRAVFLLSIAAFAVLTLSGRYFFYERLKKPLAWIPAGLLAVAYVSTALGVDWYQGFWSNFDRGDGLLSLTAVVAFFYLILVSATERFFARFSGAVAGVASFIAVYALLQWLEGLLGINLPLVATSHGRIGSTFGNAAFLAGYLGMTVWITLQAAPRLLGRWRSWAYAGAALQLLAVFITATRGTMLALIIAGGLSLVWFSMRGEGRVRSYARTALLALLVVAGVFVLFRGQLAKVPLDAVQRLASISLTDDTVASRIFIWKNILPEALKNSFLGSGAESVKVHFNTIYDPGKILEQWFDRSHNSFVDYFVQFGLLGLLLYTALIAGVAYEAYRRVRRGQKEYGLYILLAAVYAVQNFFVFDTMSSLWLLLALFALLLTREEDAEKPLAIASRTPSFVPAIAGVLLLALLWWVVALPLSANLSLAQGYLYHIADVRRAVASMHKGLSFGTYADLEYGYQAYEMYTERQYHMLSGEARVLAYQYAREVLERNYKKYPTDARTATYLGHVLDSAPPEDPANEEEKRAVLQHAIALSPKRAQPWYMLANIPIRKGDQSGLSAERARQYKEAIGIIEEYALRVPDVAEPRYIIATLYLTIDDRASAKRWADEALPLYANEGVAVAKRASRYYVTVGDWKEAKRFLAEVAAGSPGDYAALYDYAKAAFLAGDEEEGVLAAALVKQNAPDLFNSDLNFVNAYEAWVAAQ